MSAEIPLAVQISEVENEIKMRERVYFGQVARGRMKQSDADKKVRIMREVLRTLRVLHDEDATNESVTAGSSAQARAR